MKVDLDSSTLVVTGIFCNHECGASYSQGMRAFFELNGGDKLEAASIRGSHWLELVPIETELDLTKIDSTTGRKEMKRMI